MSRWRSADRRREPDDDGFSLTELVVTMSIMSILMIIFTGAILQVYRASTAAGSLSIAQTQLHLAFQRIDKEMRYASWISLPGKVGTTWYVEFAGVDPTQCRQLRLEAATANNDPDAHGLLQLIRWTRGTPPAPGVRGQTVASMLVTDSVIPPFDKQNAGSTPYPTTAVGDDFATDFQRLRIRLTTRVNNLTTQDDTTFTALNTTRDTPAANKCSEGRPSS